MPEAVQTPKRPLLPAALRWSGPLLSALYGLGVKFHRSSARPQFAPVATICIGNITVGGTGKTPATIFFARELASRGRKAAVLMRGYRQQGGDEAEEVKSALRSFDVPVILGGDRHASALDAAKRGCNVVLLDDGFQHWRLRRDLDIVLIDGSDPFGGEKLVPHGFLREPLDGLARAGALLVTRSEHLSGEERGALAERLKRYTQAPIFFARHAPSGVRRLQALSGARDMTLADLRGLSAVGACGIGNPAAFWSTARDAGVELVAREAFSDHHAYGVADVERMVQLARAKNAQAILITEKDAVKIEKLELPADAAFVSLRVEFQIDGFAHLWPAIEASLHAGDARHTIK